MWRSNNLCDSVTVRHWDLAAVSTAWLILFNLRFFKSLRTLMAVFHLYQSVWG